MSALLLQCVMVCITLLRAAEKGGSMGSESAHLVVSMRGVAIACRADRLQPRARRLAAPVCSGDACTMHVLHP